MKEKNPWTKEMHEAFHKAWSKMIAKAWNDPAFKEKLMKTPLAVFKEEGIQIPEGIQFKVDENTHKVIHLTIPEKPQGNLSESQLKDVAAGVSGVNFFSN
ncbi:MAG: NHLP leader peptide family RiPP precursor [Verrucomicrobia bacterium]|nr:NHLP leader peptide family RiPP precursor [Verrucomicrobiota bacterium]